jgi:hypothetical protein
MPLTLHSTPCPSVVDFLPGRVPGVLLPHHSYPFFSDDMVSMTPLRFVFYNCALHSRRLTNTSTTPQDGFGGDLGDPRRNANSHSIFWMGSG